MDYIKAIILILGLLHLVSCSHKPKTMSKVQCGIATIANLPHPDCTIYRIKN